MLYIIFWSCPLGSLLGSLPVWCTVYAAHDSVGGWRVFYYNAQWQSVLLGALLGIIGIMCPFLIKFMNHDPFNPQLGVYRASLRQKRPSGAAPAAAAKPSNQAVSLDDGKKDESKKDSGCDC